MTGRGTLNGEAINVLAVNSARSLVPLDGEAWLGLLPVLQVVRRTVGTGAGRIDVVAGAELRRRALGTGEASVALGATGRGLRRVTASATAELRVAAKGKIRLRAVLKARADIRIPAHGTLGWKRLRRAPQERTFNMRAAVGPFRIPPRALPAHVPQGLHVLTVPGADSALAAPQRPGPFCVPDEGDEQ